LIRQDVRPAAGVPDARCLRVGVEERGKTDNLSSEALPTNRLDGLRQGLAGYRSCQRCLSSGGIALAANG